ncbi:MAG: hypothetical protein QGI77_13670, partial [Roseibacillus sp.]|nr:hypothetical protein [Roseibacillus sp.]
MGLMVQSVEGGDRMISTGGGGIAVFEEDFNGPVALLFVTGVAAILGFTLPMVLVPFFFISYIFLFVSRDSYCGVWIIRLAVY